MLSKILSGVVGAVIVALVSWLVLTPSPHSAADHFVRDLPSGNLASYSTPALLKDPAFMGAVRQWQERDKTQHLRVEQGPSYADTETRGLSSATVDVVSHYAEVYPTGKMLNWEQDYTLTLTRSFLGGWKVAKVDTRIQAVVQVLGSYGGQGTANLAVPDSIYLPNTPVQK